MQQKKLTELSSLREEIIFSLLCFIMKHSHIAVHILCFFDLAPYNKEFECPLCLVSIAQMRGSIVMKLGMRYLQSLRRQFLHN